MTITFLITVAVLLGLLLFWLQRVRISRGAKAALFIFAPAILLLSAALAWSFFIEPNRLVVHTETIQITSWPKELSGLRIVVFSDIHVGSHDIDEAKVRTIVERTNALQPELIVILGDYITGNGWTRRRVEPEVFAPMLKELHAPLGVYSVLGNHDWWYDGRRVRAALEENGIKVLDNEVLKIQRGGNSLWLVGLADLWTRPQRIEQTIQQVPDGQPLIALTHNPDIFPRVSQRVPLLLAGHTHGGQVRFPLIGTVVQISEYGQRYVSGHVFENNHHLFVTTGIGTSIAPFRFGVPPEIVLLTVNERE
jgi:predicted MPP superfamily phosphohydrolase